MAPACAALRDARAPRARSATRRSLRSSRRRHRACASAVAPEGYTLRASTRLGQDPRWICLEVVYTAAEDNTDRIASVTAWPRKTGRGNNLFISGLEVRMGESRGGAAERKARSRSGISCRRTG